MKQVGKTVNVDYFDIVAIPFTPVIMIIRVVSLGITLFNLYSPPGQARMNSPMHSTRGHRLLAY